VTQQRRIRIPSVLLCALPVIYCYLAPFYLSRFYFFVLLSLPGFTSRLPMASGGVCSLISGSSIPMHQSRILCPGSNVRQDNEGALPQQFPKKTPLITKMLSVATLLEIITISNPSPETKRAQNGKHE